MRYLIPSLSLIVTDLVIRNGVIIQAHVENGAWSLSGLQPETRERLNEKFSEDVRVYRVPEEAQYADYNAVFAWFRDADDHEKKLFLVDNTALNTPPSEDYQEDEREKEIRRTNALALAQHGKPEPKDYFIYYIDEGCPSSDTAGALYDRTLSTEDSAQRRVDELMGKTKDMFSSTRTPVRFAFWTNKRLQGAFV